MPSDIPDPVVNQPLRRLARSFAIIVLTALVTLTAHHYNFTYPQILSASIFTLIITSALFYWDYHLPIAFVGIALLTILGVLDLTTVVQESKLDIILFLVGMMIIMGVLRDLGLFSWIIISVIASPSMTARRFVVTACAVGALTSCLVDEMTSIVFIVALVFQVCDTLNLRPVPFVIMTVMAVNIGSAGTMLGNPVGILIGQGASPPLSFMDFMTWSFPVMLAEFVVVMAFMLWNFRREIAVMEQGIRNRRAMGLRLGPIVNVPHGQGLAVLVGLMLLLVLHTQFEDWLGQPRNTMLIMTPLLVAGLLMIWRREHIRKYIENDVEWLTLIFFMMLFVVAGTLEHTQVTVRVAEGLAARWGDRPGLLLPVVLAISALGSAFIENIVFVAAFMPVVVKLDSTPLLWALLHGACIGGTITMIGSTANITALGMLERRYWTRVNFFLWLKTGAVVGLLSCLVAWGAFSILSPHMPTRAERLQAVAAAEAVQ